MKASRYVIAPNRGPMDVAAPARHPPPMSDLFAAAGLDHDAPTPLAERLRPRALADVVGQDHVLGPDGLVGRMVARGRLASLILWGPPGVGKTTIARLLAEEAGLAHEALSAVFSGVADLKKAFARAEATRVAGRATLLFVDEIHRFNKAQQDALLPVVESGVVTLVGATTENPSFEVNAALLSRCQVVVLRRLEAEHLETLLARAEAEVGRRAPLTPQAREVLLAMADGDGRFLLNLAEEVLALDADTPLDPTALAAALRRRAPVFDKGGEAHYDLISALHKAVRGSDVDAALYWLARMLEGGEDPLFIARRLVRMASEDIGLADPTALLAANAAKDAYHFLGTPEGELALAQTVIHLAAAPKSNAAYVAWKEAQTAARDGGSLPPPRHAVNAPTTLMKTLGHGAGYAYDHDHPDAFAGQDYFPDGLERRTFYRPTDRGAEQALAERLAAWAKRRAAGRA